MAEPRKPIARTSRPAAVRRTARGRAKHAADLKWAKAVRESGPCWALGEDIAGWRHVACRGDIQAAHLISRRYAATRHDPANGRPLCARAHEYYTSHPNAWDYIVAQKIGAEAFDALKSKALRGTK